MQIPLVEQAGKSVLCWEAEKGKFVESTVPVAYQRALMKRPAAAAAAAVAAAQAAAKATATKEHKCKPEVEDDEAEQEGDGLEEDPDEEFEEEGEGGCEEEEEKEAEEEEEAPEEEAEEEAPEEEVEEEEEAQKEDEAAAEEQKRVIKRPSSKVRVTKKMKVDDDQVVESYIVQASTGHIRCYLLAKVGSQKSQYISISQNESADYVKQIRELRHEAQKLIAGGISFDVLKEWAGQQKQHLL